ncbi:MAG: lysophospholipid acyltransferase family protein [Kiritimatiellae bacterium]|nr:lysophospholipid acyltransferase family protein [Kiritimatiellia bacterium]
MTVTELHATLRLHGAYQTPAGQLPERQARPGAWAAWRFYVGGLGGVVVQGLRSMRGGSFDDLTFAELAYRLLRAAERLGTLVSFEGFAEVNAHRGPIVYTGNHMSLVETIVLPAGLLAFGPLTIVARRSLTRYPGFGRALCASHPILVTRANPRQDLADVLSQGAERLAQGYSVLLFPQGTRSECFDPRRFNSLGIKLARRAGVPLVPLAVKTDFARVGSWLRDFGPVDPSRPIRFAAGPLLDAAAPQRDVHAACTAFISARLRNWGLPVADKGDSDGLEQEQQ